MTQENCFMFEGCPPSLVGSLFFTKIGTFFFTDGLTSWKVVEVQLVLFLINNS